MFNIRKGSWETNSSSVHVLVIPKDTNITVPKKVFLSGGEYGWEAGHANPLDYMYQACVDAGKEELDKFFDYLKRKGVEEIHSPELNWETDVYDGREYTYAKGKDGYDIGWIDHGYEIPLDDMFANENLLDRFLFGDGSFVETGNDNSDNCPDEEDYDPDKYDTIRKGN